MDVTLYTRRDCHLCDVAKEALHDAGITPQVIDIDSHPDLQRQYTNDVPVIFVGGREAFRHRVNISALKRMIMSAALANEKCIPCQGGVPRLKGSELAALHRELGGNWQVVDEHHLKKEFGFRDFAEALAFTNRIGAVAEKEGHHPDILLAWGKVGVTIWTHKIDGLTRSDFVLAAKIETLQR
jgi:4a-hydroxytetrahydrobiopterin dehydratase